MFQSFTAFYSHRQTATVIINIKQNISSNSVHFNKRGKEVEREEEVGADKERFIEMNGYESSNRDCEWVNGW